MDIVVTIPKSEYKNDDLENEWLSLNREAGYQFWTMNRIPRKLKEGDRVYFVKNNEIESSMNVFNIDYNNSKKCEVTNRIWKGKCILCLNDFRYEKLDIEIKGFQGFRYKWW